MHYTIIFGLHTYIGYYIMVMFLLQLLPSSILTATVHSPDLLQRVKREHQPQNVIAESLPQPEVHPGKAEPRKPLGEISPNPLGPSKVQDIKPSDPIKQPDNVPSIPKILYCNINVTTMLSHFDQAQQDSFDKEAHNKFVRLMISGANEVYAYRNNIVQYTSTDGILQKVQMMFYPKDINILTCAPTNKLPEVCTNSIASKKVNHYDILKEVYKIRKNINAAKKRPDEPTCLNLVLTPLMLCEKSQAMEKKIGHALSPILNKGAGPKYKHGVCDNGSDQNPSSGNIVLLKINPTLLDDPKYQRGMMFALAHEIGHAWGAKHTADNSLMRGKSAVKEGEGKKIRENFTEPDATLAELSHDQIRPVVQYAAEEMTHKIGCPLTELPPGVDFFDQAQ
ncbi:hypothetical protein Ddc_15744 [Ditylenchus destructor]|nr:hypothetical protein Ddc_15744 [Ditylenchus destructor]